jgi:hypothetical protein
MNKKDQQASMYNYHGIKLHVRLHGTVCISIESIDTTIVRARRSYDVL